MLGVVTRSTVKFSMRNKVSRLRVPAAQLLAQLQFAYSRRRLTVVVQASYLRPALLKAFIGWGLIGHYELLPLIKKTRYPLRPAVSYRIYLRYTGGRAAIGITCARWRGLGAAYVSVADLRVWASFGEGTTLIIATPLGWLSHTTCIRWRVGGCVVAGLLS